MVLSTQLQHYCKARPEAAGFWLRKTPDFWAPCCLNAHLDSRQICNDKGRLPIYWHQVRFGVDKWTNVPHLQVVEQVETSDINDLFHVWEELQPVEKW